MDFVHPLFATKPIRPETIEVEWIYLNVASSPNPHRIINVKRFVQKREKAGKGGSD